MYRIGAHSCLTDMPRCHAWLRTLRCFDLQGKTVLQLAAAHQPMNADIVDLLQRAGAVTCAVAVSESQDTADTAITSIAIGGAVSGAGSNETVTGPFVNVSCVTVHASVRCLC